MTMFNLLSNILNLCFESDISPWVVTWFRFNNLLEKPDEFHRASSSLVNINTLVFTLKDLGISPKRCHCLAVGHWQNIKPFVTFCCSNQCFISRKNFKYIYTG